MKRYFLFDPNSVEPFKISRSKIDLFLECPRCFYFDRRLGIKRPGFPAFSLNSAVDALLKNEFDLLRKDGQPHQLMVKYKIDAVPFVHPDLGIWRDDAHRYTGAKTLHQETNLIVDGIIDDIWIDKAGNLIMVDYKSTSTQKEISLENQYKQGYKRQIEIYQWIFRQKGFPVSSTGYFVFANAGRARDSFDGRLEFEMSIVPHIGDDSWIAPTLFKIKDCLRVDELPEPAVDCEYCTFTTSVTKPNPWG